MAESSSSGEEDFRNEAKYKQFAAAVERSLKGFEVSSEWHDLISSLARLNKTLLAYKQYPVVPSHITVCKRLSQCLHPNLPSGVHLKTLDVYKAIFNRVGTKGLSSNLLVYSSGLFPLLGYGSMSVRPVVLDIYERYYLTLGQDLIPCLPGMVLGLLPGLEDESEHTERINSLMDALCLATDEPTFFSAVWQCVLTSPRGRLPAVCYVFSKLNKKAMAEDQSQYLGGSLPVMVSALCAALLDKNVLVARVSLDIILILFPLHQPFLLPSDIVEILSSALETLLRRDMSLNRRLYSWLVGSQVGKSYMETHFPEVSRTEEQLTTVHSLYFQKFAKSFLLAAIRRIVSHAAQAVRHSAARADSILPYRLLRSLMDKPEIGDLIVSDILLDVASCLRNQIENLGGVPADPVTSLKLPHSSAKETGGKKAKKKSHKVEILQSANLFFSSLAPEQLWQWVESLLLETLNGAQVTQGSMVEQVSGRDDDVVESGLVEEDAPEGLPSAPQGDDVASSGLNSPELTRAESVQSISTRSPAHERKLSCASVCRLVQFLLQSLPLDAMEDVHTYHLPHLIWHLLHTLHKLEASTKPRNLRHFLELLLFSAHKLLEAPASRSGSTSATPIHTPATPTSSFSLSLPKGHLGSQVSSEGTVAVSDKMDSSGLPSAMATAVATPTDELRLNIVSQFLAFFSKFVHNRVCFHDNHVNSAHLPASQIELSDYVEKSFASCCQLMCVLVQLEISVSGEEALPTDSTPPSWLSGLMSVCRGSHDHHMTFTALETLLTLQSSLTLHPPLVGPEQSARNFVSLLIPNISTFTRDDQFLEAVTRCLWSCLSPDLPLLHVPAATLLTWLNTLTLCPTCETVILREFTSERVGVYQQFTVLWQYGPGVIQNTPSRPFSRAILRMVEGLQSHSTAVRCLVRAWVKFVTARGDLHLLLQPLVRIIMEQEGKRKVPPVPPADGSLVDDAGKYFYTPAGLSKEEVTLTQEEEILLVYTQVFDTDQVQYALSLLQVVLQVDPPAILSSLASSVVSVGVYATDHTSGTSFSLPDHQATPTAQKSLLEIILLSLVAFLRSEYPESLEVSQSDWIENLRVKATAVELVSCLVYHLYCVLASADVVGGASGSLVHNPSYVSALVTLCDIQKVLLLALSQAVQHLRSRGGSATGEKSKDSGLSGYQNGRDIIFHSTLKEGVSSTGGSWSRDEAAVSTSVEVLFVHLLRCLQNFITLETLCIPSSPVAMTPSDKPAKKSLSKHHQIHPGLSTAAQPFFHSLLTDILADPSLVVHHMPMLDMLSACLPNLHSQLEDLAPKILRQLCRNLEAFVKSESDKLEGLAMEESGWEGLSGAVVVGYLQALINVTLWCLFGEFPTQRVLLQHNLLNRFWDASQLCQTDDSEEALSPTSKQPSTMSWFFGVFAASGQKAVSSPVGTKAPRLGLTSRVGRSVLLLLPAVYNALSEVWRWFGRGGVAVAGGSGGGGGVVFGRRGRRGESHLERGLEAERKRVEYEDIHSLISSLLVPLASHESTTFFSSISTVWLEWDLGAKVNPSSKRISKRKDTFVAMLHHIKVLSLEQFIRSVQFSFADIAKFEDQESSVLRQKYLLHFFYKYISSSLQSSEELSACHPVLVMFLRDSYTKSYSGTTDSLLINCHLLCMLTSILHVYICRVPGLEKKQKKERKDLQDITHKLCEALSQAANSGELSRETEQEFEVVETADLRKTTVTSHLQEKRAESLVARDNTKLRTVMGEEVKGQTDTSGNLKLTSHTPEAEAGRESQGGSEGGSEGGGEGGGGERKTSPLPQTRPATPKHLATSQKEVTAGNVRATILAPPHQHVVTTVTSAGRPATRNSAATAVDPSALSGAQALAVLANTLSHFIDGVFGSSEKDRVLSLLKVVLHNVWPHLQNHSYEARKLYHHAVKLLSSLSGFQVTRKAWRRETFDLFMANNFFVMELDSLMEWKVLIDNLMTQDKTTFRDLLARLVPGLGNIFTTTGQEALNTARVVKRMSFAILSAEVDQYASYLPDIQEKLSECLKLQRHPIVSSEVFLSFRTLLLKFSATHLMSFWPAIVAETLATLHQLESDLSLELKDHTVPRRTRLHLYLSACKLLDTAWSLPTECLPHFQFLQWGFSDVSGPQSSTPSTGMGPISQIRALFSTAANPVNTSHQTEANVHLQRHSITSLRDLQPFFMSLGTFPPSSSTSERNVGHNHQTQLSAVERALLQDFLEPFLSF